MIHSWLSPWMQNPGYGGPTIKLCMDFLLHKESVPLTTTLFKHQLYFELYTHKSDKR